MDILRRVIKEIRKYSDCPVALCKESAEVWQNVGLDMATITCAYQL
jgi:spore photoproduct lyase